MGLVDPSNSDSFPRVCEEVRSTVYQECSGPSPSSCSSGSFVQDSKGTDSQEYIDAVERMEPKVEDLASRIVDNLNIVLPSPDDEA